MQACIRSRSWKWIALLAILIVTRFTMASAQQADSGTTWLDFGAVAFLVQPDTANGVQLWVSALVDWEGRAEPRRFIARYDPSVMQAWLDDAELMLLPTSAGPNDPPTMLTTGRLIDLRRRSTVAARRREGKRWSKRVLLSFDFGSELNQALTFSIEAAQAKKLFAALALGARLSHLTNPNRAAALDACGIGPDEALNAEQISAPQTLYPESLARRGMPGLVVLRFVIDTAGRAAMDDDVRVLFSTDAAFTVAARDMLARSKFKPATQDGQPVAVPGCFMVQFFVRHPGSE